jgi:hypothetical protein
MNAPVAVRLTKIAGKEDATHPIGFIVEGPAWNKPEVGKPYELDGYIKTSLNHRWEWFHTTEVTGIQKVAGGGIIITTNNSQWRIDEL